MDFKILTAEQKELYEKDILKMLSNADNEFVPPLSTRQSSLQANLNNLTPTFNGVKDYFNKMISQLILGVFLNGELVGFVAFVENYISEIISKENLPNIYISTLVLKPETRGKKLTEKAYDYLFNYIYSDRKIFTRTWSTNFAHTHILEKFSFKEFKRILNDRGNDIDTVYFVKER